MSASTQPADPTTTEETPPPAETNTPAPQPTQDETTTKPPPTETPTETKTEQPEPTTQDPTTNATTAPTTNKPAPTTTTTKPPTTANDPTTNKPEPTTEKPPPPEPTTTPSADTTITTETTDSSGSTSTLVITQTRTPTPNTIGGTTTTAETSATGTIAGGSDSSSGLSTGGKIAVAVVVPIAAVALFFIVGLYFWRKRRARKDEEEQRKQDLKDYAYNPNDPTIPPVAGAGESYEMKEDQPAGYRGWGTSTLASSVGRHPSTTMSGGGVPGEPVRSDGTVSPEGEILGAMGPPASQNRGGDIRRGPSNASSHYSLGAGSEDSDSRGIGVAYGGPNSYPQPPPPTHQQQQNGYEQYAGSNPYAENPYAFAPAPPQGRQMPAEMGGTPVIRENPSRRTTQIQNASPYVQQPGISQNF